MRHLTYQNDLICYGTHCETKGNVVSYFWLSGFVALFALPILYYAIMG